MPAFSGRFTDSPHVGLGLAEDLEDHEEALRRQGVGLAQQREQNLPGDGVTAAGLVQGVREATVHERPHGLRDEVVMPALGDCLQGCATHHRRGVAEAAGGLLRVSRA